MKTIKFISILFLSALVLSCSSDDEGSDDSDPVAAFSATINGAGYSNYNATLGSYSASGDNGFTIAVTDTNTNVVRLFMNSTDGFSSGTIKEIGNVDGSGFVTTALFRDQATQITYNSVSGSITINKNNESNEDSSIRLVSGEFDIMAIINTGTSITMSGTFENIAVFGL